MSSNEIGSVTKEIRFAVVMYGGVSLAVYINGVCQELLRMVRSTSENKPLESTLPVYRKLNYLLGDEDLLNRYNDYLNGSNKDDVEKELNDKLSKNDPIQTRFVIDILSGTSAGGINGIHLSKALVNDQELDKLKALWINEGDIKLLINDKESVKGTPLAKDNPQSLLNGRRLYLKLLESLDDMETDESKKIDESPYVDQLDLFITATDIVGQATPLRLSDKVVYEHRYKNVFRFRYSNEEKTGEKYNDFEKSFNPFLAFAARCTSSFPFAFEPMRLCDIDEVLDLLKTYRGNDDAKSSSPKWKRFFNDQMLKQPADYIERSFGDGGYLDNKPFGFAIQELSHRTSMVPVERKVIYVEPSPEHAEDEPQGDRDSTGRRRKPDAVSNAKAALLDLPTYETIREDLNAILERNRFIDQVNRILQSIENDGFDPAKLPVLDFGKWINMTQSELIDEYGISFLSYQRLRVADVTDDLAEIACAAEGFDSDSDQFKAIYCLIRAWRNEQYNDQPMPAAVGDTAEEAKKKSEKRMTANRFLSDFDLSYQIRRLKFLISKIDDLHRCVIQIQNCGDPGEDQNKKKKIENLLANLKDKLVKGSAMQAEAYRVKMSVTGFQLTIADLKKLCGTLLFIRCNLNLMYKSSIILMKQLNPHPRTNLDKGGVNRLENPIAIALRTDLQQLKLTPEHLDYILGVDIEGFRTINKDALLKENDNCGRTPNSLHEDRCVKRAENLLNPANSLVFFGQSDFELKKKLNKASGFVMDAIRGTLHWDTIGKSGNQLRLNRYGAFLNPGDKLDYDPNEAGSEQCAKIAHDPGFDKTIRKYLYSFYSHFDLYDQVTFPILYNTDAGELEPVGVIRISPEDATSLIKERNDDGSPSGRTKLAGTALAHFGAFLDKSWRENDLMWGRLDGAERLIESMLPDQRLKLVKEALIKEANGTIVQEELKAAGNARLTGLMTDALIRAGSGQTIETAVEQTLNVKISSPSAKVQFGNTMLSLLKIDQIIDYIKNHYEVNRTLNTEDTLKSAARASQVTGKVLEDIANRKNVSSKGVAWIARLGLIFWGLIEVAVPNSASNLIASHWIKLLYAFEIFTIAGAMILGHPGVQTFGWTALGITVVINLLIYLLGDWMQGKKAVLRLLVVVGLLLVLFLAGLGILDILAFFRPSVVASAGLDPSKHQTVSQAFAQNWLPDLKTKIPYLLGVLLAAVALSIIVAWKKSTAGQNLIQIPKRIIYQFRIVGIVSLIVVGIGIYMARSYDVELLAPVSGVMHGTLALELSKTSKDVSDILSSANDARQKLGDSIFADYFFIAAYGLSFILMSILLIQRSRRGAVAAGLSAGTLAILAVGFDLWENYRMKLALSLPAGSDYLPVFTPSIMKWFCIFAAVALLAYLFYRLRGACGLLSYLFWFAAAMGFAGLVYHPLIGVSLGLIILGQTLTGLLFIFLPRRYAVGF